MGACHMKGRRRAEMTKPCGCISGAQLIFATTWNIARSNHVCIYIVYPFEHI